MRINLGSLLIGAILGVLATCYLRTRGAAPCNFMDKILNIKAVQ